MWNIKKKYREQITVNKRLWCEVENLKMQVYEIEKKLAFMKSDSIY